MYTVVIERNRYGRIVIDRAASTPGVNFRLSYIGYPHFPINTSPYMGDTLCVTLTIENDPAYAVVVEKVDENNNAMKISGAGFSIIDADKEFDETATVNGYAVTSGGTAMVQIRDHEDGTTRRYVITEEVLPNGYNRMGEFGKVMVDVTTSNQGYVTDIEIIEKEGYDGKDVCEVIYEKGHFAKIRIKDKPIPEPSYTVKIIKEDEDDKTIRLPGATFNVNVQSERTTTFTWPVEGVAPFPITTIQKGGLETDTSTTTNSMGIATATGNRGTGENVITITETSASPGYLVLDEPVTVVINREVTAESTVEDGIIKTAQMALNKEKTDEDVDVVIDHAKQEVIVTLKNKLAYDVVIEKVDKDDEAIKLEGAEFELERVYYTKDDSGKWVLDKELNKNFTTELLNATSGLGITGYNEEVMLTNKMVEYKLIERSAPENYKTISEAIKFRVEYGEDANAINAELMSGEEVVDFIFDKAHNRVKLVVKNELSEISNQDKPLTIQLVKEFAGNGNIKLEGAFFNFGIEHLNGKTQNIIKTTDETGNLTIGNIVVKDSATILMTELIAPEGFELSEEEIKLQVEKYADGSTTVDATTLINGEVQGGQNNKYTVLYDDVNGVIKIVYKNELISSGIGISKVTALDPQIMLTDVEFVVKDSETDETYTIITGPDGAGMAAIEPKKEAGVYEFRIKEVSTTEGYKLLEEEIVLQIEYNDNEEIINTNLITGSSNVTIATQDDKYVELQIKNEEKERELPLYNVIVRKSDIDDFEWVLPNAELKIDIDNQIGPKGITKTDLTDKNGEIALSNLHGTGEIEIKITEITPPPARKFDSKTKYVKIIRDVNTDRMKLDISKNADTIIDNVNKVITIVIRNEVDNGLFNIAVNKKDKDHPDINLPNATFELELYNVLNMTETTGENGVAYFEGIPIQPVGKYKFKLKELEAPLGYNLIEPSELILEITFGGELGKLVIKEAKITNAGKDVAEIVVLKDKYMKINVYDENDGTGGQGEDDQGGEGENEENIEGEGTYTLRINKVDEEYREIGIEGAKFGVTIDSESGEKLYVEGTTNKDGVYEIKGLRGTGNISATIKELEAPSGYELDSKEKEVKYIRGAEDKLIKIESIDDTMTGNTYAEEKNIEVYITNKISDEYFDLHIEKYLSHINGEKVSEGPRVSIDEQGKITYIKDKIEKELKIGDELIYTIRVYNEGKEEGYAKTIVDNIPEGLDYVERHEINRKYEWKIKEKNKVETNYLSKESESEERNNIIKVYDKETERVDYKEVQIAFKLVGEKGEGIIENKGEIAEETDKDGNKKESTGRNEIDNETGEKHEIRYVDLETVKYISKIIVKDTGNNTEKEYEYGEEKDGMKKIEISASRINKTEVYIEYVIKVINNGNKAGKIASLVDNIPEGLKFDEMKNTGWKLVDGNAENTELLGEELQPGESKEVKIRFTWEGKNSKFGGIENKAVVKSEEGEIDEENGKIDGEILDENLENTDNTGNATIIIGINTGGIFAEGINNIILVMVIITGGIAAIVVRRKRIAENKKNTYN